MGLSGRLCNSTPWDVAIPWHKTKIRIAGDGHFELHPQQVDDFRPGKPGSEEVRRMLNFYGCFLFDTDRSFDVQIYEALQACLAAKKERYRDFVGNLRNERIKAGQSNVLDEDLEGVIQMQGYGAIREQIETMERRIAKLKTILEDTGELGRRTSPKYDPERTCFGTTPPREFQTKLALELFLDENPEAAEQHQKFLTQMNATTKARGKDGNLTA